MKRSIKLLVSLAFLFSYTVWSFASFYYDTRENAKAAQVRIRERMINHSQLAYLLLESDKVDHVNERLREAKNANEIAAYRLKKGDTVIGGIDRQEIIDKLSPSPHGVPVHGAEYSYLTTVEGPYELVIVVNDSIMGRVKAIMSALYPLLLRDLAICFLLTIGIVSFFMKDITELLRNLKKGRKAGLSRDVKARTTEGHVLLKGLAAMSGSIDDLESRNKILEAQVLPALRGELKSGKIPPYEFDCTLVRVDVNDFSRIFNHYPIEPFMAVINGFFESVSHVVDRYGGYVYEFIGDEVVFYFKDEESGNSALSAIASLRDICREADELDRRVYAEHGYHFRIKCSASHGKPRFGRQVHNYSLAGAVLIDTVRVLSLIDEKERNVIFFDESIETRVSSLVQSRLHQEVVLKGSSLARRIYEYKSYESVLAVLATPDRWHQLCFFRSDDDLISLLSMIADPRRHKDDFLRLARELRGLTIRKPSPKVAVSYRDLLDSLLDSGTSYATPEGEDLAVKLSAALALAKNLLTKGLFERELRSRFTACLNVPERRVIANAIEGFSQFESISEDEVLSSFMRNKDNRVSANAVVREGMRELSPDVVKRLSNMLDEREPLFIASALFAIGELAAYHRANDPVYLETHEAFGRLVGEVAALADHHDEMVRRQATIATSKIQTRTAA